MPRLRRRRERQARFGDLGCEVELVAALVEHRHLAVEVAVALGGKKGLDPSPTRWRTSVGLMP
jgi:hypothetical protein